MIAILEQAMVEYLEPIDERSPPRRRRRHQARRWIDGPDDNRWPFSFTAVCEALALDPQAVRAAVWAKARNMPDAMCHPTKSGNKQEVA
jgi:hypothetical protein